MVAGGEPKNCQVSKLRFAKIKIAGALTANNHHLFIIIALSITLKRERKKKKN